jgi:outer membrane protein assembly factor BamB
MWNNRSRPAWRWTAGAGCLLVMMGFAATAPRGLAEDWSQWRGPHRSGSVDSSPPLRSGLPPGGLSPTWVSEENFVGGGGWSSPIVAAGRVFIYTHRQHPKPGSKPPAAQYPPLSDEKKAGMSSAAIDAYEELRIEEQMTRLKDFFDWSDEVCCLEATTGKTLWKHQRPSGATRWRQSSTPLFEAEKLAYFGADRAMVCLDASSGQPQWITPLPHAAETDEPMVSSPVSVAGKVVVNAGRLLAYDWLTGKIAWQGDAAATRGIYSSPAVWPTSRGNYLIAHAGKGKTLCVDPNQGEVLWTVETLAERSSPTIVGDRLLTYGGSRKGGLRCYQLSWQGAELLWLNQRLNDSGSSPTVMDGWVFVRGESQLACLDLETGEPGWTLPIDATDSRYTSPLAAAGKIFFAAEGLLCLAADGRQLQSVFDGCILADQRLVSKAEARDRLGIEALEQQSDSAHRIQELWQKEVIGPGPLRCVTPALVAGKLFLRTNARVVCYDLKE